MKPEVLGPANDVPILMPDNSYGYASGTSSATAYVSGILALMLEANPNLTGGDESTIESVKQLLWRLQNQIQDRMGTMMITVTE